MQSLRRRALDRSLFAHMTDFKGVVLDVGGKKVNGRTRFVSPVPLVTINIEKDADIVAAVPPIPWQSEGADIIVCCEVLEYIKEPQELIKEFLRVLKPGGVLLLATPFLHPRHGDADSDYFRFCESYFHLHLKGFSSVNIERHGGVWSVVFDCLRTRYYRSFFFRKFFTCIAPLVERFDRPNPSINTGFFIRAVK